MWDFLNRIMAYLMRDFSERLDVIQQTQLKMEKLVMAIKDDLQAFAVRVDNVTNGIAANVDAVAALINDLKAQLAAGTLSPADLSAALDPVVAHLTTVSDNLKAVAEGGAVVVPPVEPL